MAVVKRGGQLRRYTPLYSRSSLTRTTTWPAPATARSQLHANSAVQRRQPKRSTASRIPANVRKGLALRSGDMCEVAQPGCTWTATDFSHRHRVGMGGRHGTAAVAHHVLSNALAACRTCHSQRLHANPAEAYAAGWMLREQQTPTRHRVLYRGAWRWLTDDGLVLTTNPHTA